ncbi:TRAFAC clade GTPase domain-containing protein [Cellulomonas hominis]|uniref:TRAFAC clade GTPase domain-containing protein n=1 Tax=Cellulomonas hominis TaxID=156981 RepID=UPI0014444521|nr:ATP/GTP-binding protein [Cellulomonas hominis]NKY08833.1 ATP/GTP-binding protein [Cellulomonas hominis]
MAAPTLRVREQNIAVFGGSGSGKTVLISSFYGATQEPAFSKDSLFDLIADDTGQGNRLRQNYLGMKNSALAPEPTRFAATTYSFTVKLKEGDNAKAAKSRPFDALRLVWHDYPGEWFEEEPSSEQEAERRLEAFRRLLRSDVAVILVDGQKLLDYAGEEEKYLKSMLWGLRDGLRRLKADLLDDGEPLVEFPRIWILALSKADLHPDLDVRGFQDLLIEKAAGDIGSLHDELKSLVELPEALSLGEDFMLLSSAKFEPGNIVVTERKGVPLLLPVACVLPLERLVQWTQRFEIPRKVLDQLVDNADVIARVLVGSRRLIERIPVVGSYLAVALPFLAQGVKEGAPIIAEKNRQARANHDYLTAALTQFKLDLEQAVKDRLLVKSRK